MEYNVVAKTFVKSHNKTSKIINRYFYSLVAFIVLTILSYLIFDKTSLIIPLLKSIALSFLIASILSYFINLVFKDTNFLNIYKKDNIHIISLIISLFAIDTKVSVLTLAILITLIIKKTFKRINLSSVLYIILFIILYKYFNHELITPLISFMEMGYYGTYEEVIKNSGGIASYLIGINYLSPILAIFCFIYLFHKKSIKYSIVFSYILTFSLIMLFFGFFKEMNIWLLFFELTTGNILFLTIYTLTDYMVTPTINEGQVIYGIILGIISAILRFIVPELAIIIPFIIGPILLTKPIERMSAKLKYNKKLYRNSLLLSCLFIIITTAILIVLR